MTRDDCDVLIPKHEKFDFLPKNLQFMRKRESHIPRIVVSLNASSFSTGSSVIHGNVLHYFSPSREILLSLILYDLSKKESNFIVPDWVQYIQIRRQSLSTKNSRNNFLG